MKKIIALSMMALCTNNALFSQYHYRNMVILLDWDVETLKGSSYDYNNPMNFKSGFGATMSKLVSALVDESSMIIVSSVTWKNFIGRRQTYENPDNAPGGLLIPDPFEQLIEKFKNNTKPTKQYKSSHLQYVYRFFVCSLPNLDAWTVKKINEYFYCLVPNKYFDALKGEFPDKYLDKLKKEFLDEYLKKLKGEFPDEYLKKFEEEFPDEYLKKLKGEFPDEYLEKLKEKFLETSEDDIFLGINWKNLTDISDKRRAQDFPDEADIPVDQMGELFNDAVRQLFKQKIEGRSEYEWLLYVSGHGSQQDVSGYQKSIIAGLSIEEFKRFLQFCNDAIRTRFLLYTTCYAGGENLEIPFQGEQGLPLVYNFYIASGTLIASLHYSSGLPKIDFPINKENLKINMFPDYTQYFQLLKDYFGGGSSGLLTKAIEAIRSSTQYEAGGVVYQVPVVRFPHTEWFQLADVKDSIQHLSRVKIETATAANKSIKIRSGASIIIVEGAKQLRPVWNDYYDGILVPLKISGYCPQKFIISSSQKELTFYFDEIDASNCNVSDVLESLLWPEKGPDLTIMIGTLKAHDDIGIVETGWEEEPEEKNEFKNIVIRLKDQRMKEYGESYKSLYTVTFNDDRKTFGFFNQRFESQIRKWVSGDLRRSWQEVTPFSRTITDASGAKDAAKDQQYARTQELKALMGVLQKRPQELRPPKEVKPKPQPQPPTPQEFPPTGDEIADALNQFAYSLGELAYQVGQ